MKFLDSLLDMLAELIDRMSDRQLNFFYPGIFLLLGAALGAIIGLIAQGVCMLITLPFAWVHLWWYIIITGFIGALIGYVILRLQFGEEKSRKSAF